MVGDEIPDNPVRHASTEYQCHDCSTVIRAGDLYYNRHTDFTILCMKCYEARNQRWRKLRDSSEKEREMLTDLRLHEREAHDLQDKYGTRYISLLRKLRMKGHAIWRTRLHGHVIYHIEETQEPGVRCQDCGRLFTAPPDTITAKRRLCPDCFASLGIMSPFRRVPE